jgi:sugar lactone lactonase YvrE
MWLKQGPQSSTFVFPSAYRVLLGLLLLSVVSFGIGCKSMVPSNLASLAINSFSATPPTISVGQDVSLVWSVAGAQSLTITSGSGTLMASDLTAVSSNSVSVTPTTTTTYTLTAADNNGKTVTATTTVTVAALPVIQSFTATPSLISNAQSSTLNWVVSGAATLSIDNGVGLVTGNSVSVAPTGTTTYTLTATNAAGSVATATTTVSVVLAPSILSFTANPAEVGSGLASTLSWSVIGATSLSIDNGVGVVTGSSVTVHPTQTTTYTLTATNSLGSFSVSTIAQTTVKVSLVPPPTISSFTASVPSVGPGTTVTLTPVFIPADGTATATIDNGVGTVTSGVPVDTPPLSASTTFTLTVTNESGSATAQQRVLAGKLEVYAGSPTNTGSTDDTGRLARFNQPYGMAVDAQGNLFVADSNNDLIRKIAPGGVVTTFAGEAGIEGSNDGNGTGVQFNAPSGVTVDTAGNVYVADSGNYTIRILTPAGDSQVFAGSNGVSGSNDGPGTQALFNGLQQITIDSSGNLYVTDALNCNIRKITPAAVVSTLAGPTAAGQCGNVDGVGAAARFNNPNGIAVDSNGNIYVADQNNSTIRKISPDGVVSTFAGSTRGSVDGNGTNAKFTSPTGVAVDAAGNVYVGDSSFTIRKIDPAANVTTIVGKAGIADPQLTGGPLPSRITSPHGIVADPVSGNLFVSFSTSAITSSPF